MMIKHLISFLLFASFPLYLWPAFFQQKDPLIVRLETETPLIPIFLSFSEENNESSNKEYFGKLREILAFDLNNNGTLFITSKEKESLYKVLCRIKKDKLSCKIIASNHSFYHQIDELLLEHRLSLDRKKLHRLADDVHLTITGNRGIASTHILYTLRTKKGNKWKSEVIETDFDGENRKELTQNCGYCVTPTYLPPKTGCRAGSFLYVSFKTGQSKIYVASLKEKFNQPLFALPGNQLMPAVSRQRNKIAFISDITGNPNLFLLGFDPEKGPLGKPKQILGLRWKVQGSPTFSPDGNKIAFVSNKDGLPRLYLLTLPKEKIPFHEIKGDLLTTFNRESSAPQWSPDGNKIAYCSKTDSIRQIWIYDLQKKEEKQLTFGSRNKENPTWAPDSFHLLYNTTDFGACELYLINTRPSNPIQISFGPGEKRFPSWEPLP